MITQEKVEKNVGLLIGCTLFAIIWALLVEIVPLSFQKSTTEPVQGLKPYDALSLAGRDVYIREGCYNCHSQMVRPFRSETERYGHYSVAGEFVYDHPFQWGSKRTGPDLHRVGGRYSDEWHLRHLTNPRDVVPESNMPAFAWLNTTKASDGSGKDIADKMRALRKVGVPYTDADISGAPAAVAGKTEMEALIAYLQGLGLAMKPKAQAATPTAPPADGGRVVCDKSLAVGSLAKFYFPTGKYEMSDEAKQCAGWYADFAKANPQAKFVISGFHDSSGSLATNQELAKNRAVALRQLLTSGGVAADNIEMLPPADTLGSGDAAESRRVELVIK